MCAPGHGGREAGAGGETVVIHFSRWNTHKCAAVHEQTRKAT